MRLLIANEGADDHGGVDTYLRRVIPALRARGHEVAFLHHGRQRGGSQAPAEPAFSVLDSGLASAADQAARWAPDVVFSHNMRPLDVDLALLQRWPVVKMMHGYFGTCISGQKAYGVPSRKPCGKPFDAACLAYFFPRRCGQLSPLKMARQYGWAKRQQGLFSSYASIVVASEHMRVEYIRNGASAERVHALPLFAPPGDGARAASSPDGVLFLGRMTDLKGGDLLVRATAHASRLLGRPVALVMAGEGPARRAWERLARTEGVPAEFTGWVDPPARARLLDRAAVLVVPSVWPEPFGLVGLEAAAAGVPAIAFDVGGIREWLRDRISGIVVTPGPDVTRLGAAIAGVCGDPARRDILAAGALAVARELTIDRHVDALLARALEPASRAQHGSPGEARA